MPPVSDPANGGDAETDPDAAASSGELPENPALDADSGGDRPDPCLVRRAGGVPRARLDEHAVSVVRRLQQYGHEAYLVGGCVRDLLCGLEPKDFDVATDAYPNRIKRLFRNARVIGRRFRLVHVRFPGDHVIEVSTFRADPSNHECSDGTGHRDWRDSAENIFGTAPEDAHRRDFTVNALYYDPIADEVLDWVGGLDDLDRRIIECIGDPVERICEDPVRMLRAVHFAQRMDFALEPGLESAIRTHASCLTDASHARLYIELVKLLSRGRARGTFAQLMDLGVLPVWLPELCERWDDPAPSDVHATIGEHTMALLGAADDWGMAAHHAPESLALALLFGSWLRARGPRARRRGHTAFVDHVDRAFRPVAVRMSIPRWATTEMREALWAQGALRDPPGHPGRTHAMMRRRSFPAALRLFALDCVAQEQDLGGFEDWVARAEELDVPYEFLPPHLRRAQARPHGRQRRPGRRKGRRGGRRRGPAHRRRRDVTPEADAPMPPPES